MGQRGAGDTGCEDGTGGLTACLSAHHPLTHWHQASEPPTATQAQHAEVRTKEAALSVSAVCQLGSPLGDWGSWDTRQTPGRCWGHLQRGQPTPTLNFCRNCNMRLRASSSRQQRTGSKHQRPDIPGTRRKGSASSLLRLEASEWRQQGTRAPVQRKFLEVLD